MALVLAIAVHPVIGWARRRGAPQWLAVPLTSFLVFAVLIGLVLTMVVAVGQLATALPDYADRLDELLGHLRSALDAAGVGEGEVRTALSDIEPSSIIGFVTGLLSAVLGVASNLLFVLATVLFMSVDGASRTPPVRPLASALSAGENSCDDDDLLTVPSARDGQGLRPRTSHAGPPIVGAVAGRGP